MIFDVTAMAPEDFQKWYDLQVATAEATPPPPPSGGPGGSGEPPASGGTVVNLTAKNVSFEEKTLTAPADQPWTIHFDNQDAGTPHDIDILASDNGQKILDTKEFPGVAAQDFPVEPLAAGSYRYECSIHPSLMFGTLTVQ
jgi:plastocyanin